MQTQAPRRFAKGGSTIFGNKQDKENKKARTRRGRPTTNGEDTQHILIQKELDNTVRNTRKERTRQNNEGKGKARRPTHQAEETERAPHTFKEHARTKRKKERKGGKSGKAKKGIKKGMGAMGQSLPLAKETSIEEKKI